MKLWKRSFSPSLNRNQKNESRKKNFIDSDVILDVLLEREPFVHFSQHLRSFLKVLPFTDRELAESLSSGFKDFENGVQYYIALNNGIDAIVTRNAVDYSRASGVNVISPKEMISGMEE